MKQAKYLWLDLETTGLDPSDDGILEIAVIVTGSDYRPIESWEALIGCQCGPETVAERKDQCDASVVAIHDASGLWDALAAAPCDVSHFPCDYAHEILTIIEAHSWDAGWPILAGSSVHFDRGFIAVDMPALDRALHYRHFDVSVLERAWEDVGQSLSDGLPKAHRAMADVERSIALAQRHRARIS